MPTAKQHTIKEDTIALLQTHAKKPLTYEAIVQKIQAKHPGTSTSVKTVQWYASRLRAAGEEVHVMAADGTPHHTPAAKKTAAKAKPKAKAGNGRKV